MNKTVEQTIFEMMTENTGRAMCDSGDYYGRNHEKNASKTIEDFRAAPAATLGISYWAPEGLPPKPEFSITVDIFHKLTNGLLEFDDLCREYNAMPVPDWDGDYYGTSSDQFEWLELQGFVPNKDSKKAFNTYNWQNSFSQILQGQFLTSDHGDGEDYVLLQIHGGCDARGGYTNAKLFKMDTAFQEHYMLLKDDCSFGTDESEPGKEDWISLEWYGEWITREGQCADDDYLAAFAARAGAKPGEPVTLHGDISE